MRQIPLHELPRDALDPLRPTGLILAGMGGPDGPDAVAPFLRNLFRDPAVLPLPPVLARLVGAMIVRRRTAAVRERYASLGFGGGSPQLDWARRQCAKLEKLMLARGLAVRAAPAMRYWHPFAEQTVADLWRRGARQFLVVPAYPQFSHATSGTTLSAVCRAVAGGLGAVPMHAVRDWHLLPGYLSALADRAVPTLRRWAAEDRPPAACALLAVAHSLPERFVQRGDPYLDQTRASVQSAHRIVTDLLADRHEWWSRLAGGDRPLLAFQSKVGPVRWVGPDVVAETVRLAGDGCRHLLVLPVSFTCEHIETLCELDVELAATAKQAGIVEFVRAGALNLDERWLESLADHLVETVFAARADAARSSALEVGRA